MLLHALCMAHCTTEDTHNLMTHMILITWLTWRREIVCERNVKQNNSSGPEL